jgi:hypothetical protein
VSSLAVEPAVGSLRDGGRDARHTPARLAARTAMSTRRLSSRATATVVALSLGAIGVAVAFIMISVIGHAVQAGVNKATRINPPSKSEEDYRLWQSSNSSDSPAKYWNVYFYNLTNLPQLLAGSTEPPSFQEVGPYVFREFIDRFQVNFSGDNSQVSYYERSYYTVENETLAQLGDRIVNAWFPFAAAKQQAGPDDGALLLGLTPAFLGFALRSFAAALEVAGGLSPDDAQAMTVAQWGAAIGFAPLNVSQYQSYAQSPAVLDAVTLANGGSTLASQLLQALADLKLLPEWGAFAAAHNFPGAAISANMSQALLFGQGPYAALAPCPLLLDTSQAVVCPASGAAPCVPHAWLPPEAIPCSAFYLALSDVQRSSLFQLIPNGAGDLFAEYLTAATTAMFEFAKGRAQMADARLPLWVSRTPQQWLFDFDDLFLSLVTDGAQSNSALFTSNYSSDAEAQAATQPITKLTGMADPADSQKFVAWHGVSVLPQRPGGSPAAATGFWCNGNVSVSGFDDDQFPPSRATFFYFPKRLSRSSVLEIFVEDLYRPMNFTYVTTVPVKGINTWRFAISDESLANNSLYNSSYDGLLDMACPLGGPPIVLSLPHFLHADTFPPEWMCGGVSPADPSVHETFLDIEPITGSTFRGFERLQVNLMVRVPNILGANQTQPKLVPLLWIEKTSQLTDKEASDFRQVDSALHFRRVLFLGLLISGGALFVLAALYLVVLSQQGRCYSAPQGATYEEALLNPNAGDLSDE